MHPDTTAQIFLFILVDCWKIAKNVIDIIFNWLSKIDLNNSIIIRLKSPVTEVCKSAWQIYEIWKNGLRGDQNYEIPK